MKRTFSFFKRDETVQAGEGRGKGRAVCGRHRQRRLQDRQSVVEKKLKGVGYTFERGRDLDSSSTKDLIDELQVNIYDERPARNQQRVSKGNTRTTRNPQEIHESFMRVVSVVVSAPLSARMQAVAVPLPSDAICAAMSYCIRVPNRLPAPIAVSSAISLNC